MSDLSSTTLAKRLNKPAPRQCGANQQRRTTVFHVTDKRINAAGNAVFDLWRRTDRGFDNHMATIEVRGDAGSGIKVLLGALTPQGKERAWEAIRKYEAV